MTEQHSVLLRDWMVCAMYVYVRGLGIMIGLIIAIRPDQRFSIGSDIAGMQYTQNGSVFTITIIHQNISIPTQSWRNVLVPRKYPCITQTEALTQRPSRHLTMTRLLTLPRGKKNTSTGKSRRWKREGPTVVGRPLSLHAGHSRLSGLIY